MRSMTLLAVFPLLIMTPALAQDQPSSSSGNTIQQQVQNNLKQAGLARARESALAHHVHRTAPMGARVLIIGIWY